MLAYQFQQTVPPSHVVTIELPPNAPIGQAQVIVLFSEEQVAATTKVPRFANMAEFATWLQTQPPTGRTAEEIDQYIRDERDSWE